MNKYKEGSAKVHLNTIKMMEGHHTKALRGFEWRDLYAAIYGVFYSESGYTARLREIDRVHCNLTYYTYGLAW